VRFKTFIALLLCVTLSGLGMEPEAPREPRGTKRAGGELEAPEAKKPRFSPQLPPQAPALAHQLFQAAAHGDSGALRQALTQGAWAFINALDSLGNTPLNYAIYNNHPEIVHELLIQGAFFTIPDRQGNLPIHIAAQQQNPELIREFLNRGISTASLNTQLATPLYIATLHNNQDVVRELLARGTYANTRDETGDTPLHAAVMGGANPGIIRELVAHGADVNSPNGEHETPLDVAVRLLYHSETPPSPEYHARIIAAAAELIRNGATVNAANKEHIELVQRAFAGHPLQIAIALRDMGQIRKLLGAQEEAEYGIMQARAHDNKAEVERFELQLIPFAELQEALSLAVAQGTIGAVELLIPFFIREGHSDTLIKIIGSFLAKPKATLEMRGRYQAAGRLLRSRITTPVRSTVFEGVLPLEERIPIVRRALATMRTQPGLSLHEIVNYDKLLDMLPLSLPPASLPEATNRALRFLRTLIKNPALSEQERTHYEELESILQPASPSILVQAYNRINEILKSISPENPEGEYYIRLQALLSHYQTVNPEELLKQAMGLIRQRLQAPISPQDRQNYQELQRILQEPITQTRLATLPLEVLNRIFGHALASGSAQI
jgi:ankyrin repeat protein